MCDYYDQGLVNVAKLPSKLWNSISNGIKTTENISEFKTLLKKWNGTPCICKNCIICTISYM